ncbi:LysR family transcriptional regulator [Novosphingobium nitrogenifigens DSM 19370]|uniref:LysR family transcriptional regulator n=1 Tax=Novosphingobium nitrogenifigens DSM 19370 TaxID=983920 RepID=F1Z3Q3_9SPHN|nr:LysR family transcriptional regulator [Novosphingobium nitrogenifigens]EGD60666.1 LysR family transcriptional regulator [Novosphingobium nitrogenifigens DSM 19370]
MEWDDLRHFSAFVAAGSLSGAARTLGIEHATVARRIAALEARLKLRLIDRRGRRLVLTGEGEKVAALAARMAETMRAVERLADGARSDLAGEVTISAPPAYAAHVLAPRLVPLRARHPGLTLRLLGELHAASLDRREADIAVRLSRPEAGELTAARIGTIAFHLHAAPAYLAATPREEWTFIGSAGVMAGSAQQAGLAKFVDSHGSGESGFSLQSDSVDIQAALAAAGGGVAILPDFLTASRPDLVRVPDQGPPITREVWLAIHTDMKNAAPVRVVMEALRGV